MPNIPDSILGKVPPTAEQPGLAVIPVTAHDVNVLVYPADSKYAGQPAIARRICVGTGGRVAVRSAWDGSTASIVVGDGGTIDGYFDKVLATHADGNTSALNIVAQT